MGATIQELETQLSTLNANWNADKVTIPVNIDVAMETVADFTEMGGRFKQFFVADDTYDVFAIKGVHNKVQTSADGCAVSVWKVTGTTAPEDATLNLITDTAYDGSAAVYKGFNLKGIAVHTVTDLTLTTNATSLRLVAGDRLVHGVQGTISSCQITLTTVLKRARA